jgi:hypothetical protein
MAVWTRAGVILMVAATALHTADPAIQELFNKARTKVLDNAKRMPRYTCVETVDRTQYAPTVDGNGRCEMVVAMRRLSPAKGAMLLRDRLRLDVAVVDGGEIFSWAGARKFETHEIDKLVGGVSGSGEFGGFLRSVFGDEPDQIRFLGRRNDSMAFDYNVPLEKSTYQYRTSGPQHTVPFRGSFLIDPTDAELEQLKVEVDQFAPADGACRAEHTMNYQRVKIGSGEFMLPEVSTMDVLYRTGGASLNETHFSDCREYVGESTIRFDDADDPATAAAVKAASQPLPPKVRLQVGLAKPVDTTIAAAGDAIDGVLLKDAGDKKTGVVAHAGDRLHGRILRLQQYMTPTPRWFFVVRFDSIERSGIEQTISLKPLDDGNRSPQPIRRQVFPQGALDKPDGAGVFIFEEHGNMTIDSKFRSEWVTR